MVHSPYILNIGIEFQRPFKSRVETRSEREFTFPVIPGSTSLKFPVPSRGIL